MSGVSVVTEVKVPTTGNAGEPAVVLDINVSVGDNVERGDVVATLETAKATVEVDAPEGGVVLDVRFAEGDEAPEHDVLLVLGTAGEAAPSAPAPADAEPSVAADTVAVSGNAADEEGTERTPRRRISIAPRARRLAQEHRVDIAALTGSGPFGRIVAADVEAAIVEVNSGQTSHPDPARSTATAQTAQAQPPVPVREGRRMPVRGARKITAQRMHASLQNSAQVTLTRYVGADALHSFADRVKDAAAARGVEKIGINDLLLFATARTLVRHPGANSWFEWDAITEFDHVDLGFAVDTGAALLVPVIRDAHTLGLAELAGRAHTLIDRSRAGKLTAEEMEGGTFTVSNLGGAGIHWFTPVLNTPQSCILGVGATHRAGPDAPAQLPLSLTFDHRAIDGSAAAALLSDLATSIEYIDTLAAF